MKNFQILLNELSKNNKFIIKDKSDAFEESYDIIIEIDKKRKNILEKWVIFINNILKFKKNCCIKFFDYKNNHKYFISALKIKKKLFSEKYKLIIHSFSRKPFNKSDIDFSNIFNIINLYKDINGNIFIPYNVFKSNLEDLLLIFSDIDAKDFNIINDIVKFKINEEYFKKEMEKI